uniref:ATP-dependent RNA helicase n=1 Tax=Scleropages formosus TaxID=113540 RepID=A0A8C9W3D4_SCLFO
MRRPPARDPVENFEKWKIKYSRTKSRVKQQRKRNKKPEWQVERDNIGRLLNKYSEMNVQDAVKFSDFPLSKKTIGGLLGAQYRQPTEIQRQTVGFALRGRDVLGAAKTGSGKTLAFLVPVLECLYRQQWTAEDGLGALIISPTRELAYQTYEVLRKVGKNHEFSAGLIIGGKDLQNESERIHRTNIIVCTPGRLLQHMDETCTFHASNLQILVLDEADRILDMGFAETLNAIVENLPRTRQTLLFSATQTKSVKDLARLSLKDPEYVWVHEKAKFSTPATLEQSYVVCELHQKVDLLFSFMRSHLQKKVIVFFACCKEVQYLYRVFCRLRPGIPVLALHGKQQQMKRVEVYDDFVRKKAAVLFATDIAARGLDFPAVNWVLQYDCPEDANTYIHRVGRTARYKEGGEALLILLPSEEKAMLEQLQERKVPISRIQVNPKKLSSVQQKLEAFLAQEKEQKERAQRCFVSYLLCVSVRARVGVHVGISVGAEKPCRGSPSLFAWSCRNSSGTRPLLLRLSGSKPGEQASEEDAGGGGDDSSDSDDGEEPGSSAVSLLGQGAHEDEDDDGDLAFLTVKRRDVFEQEGCRFEEEGKTTPTKKAEKESKFKEAKKVMKRKLRVNTKMAFTDDGEVVQQWPPIQRAAVPAPDEEETSGINMDEARERLRREDQEFDKEEYRRKVKEKHRVRGCGDGGGRSVWMGGGTALSGACLGAAWCGAAPPAPKTSLCRWAPEAGSSHRQPRRLYYWGTIEELQQPDGVLKDFPSFRGSCS